MPETPKEHLQRYLQAARDAILWKLDGLTPYDQRRPLVPTGTNLLGIVKHLAGVELGYFGEVFGRTVEDLPDWLDSEEPNADMFATADESAADVIALYHRAWENTAATVADLPLDAPGEVPWWSEARRHVTLQQVLVHVIAETNRHAGHADLLRELIDGAAGLRLDNSNLPPVDPDWWTAYRERLELIARDAEA